MSRAMKDSGIPWIGEIPSHWRVEQIGSCIKEVNCPNTDNAEDNALQFKMGTIISKKGGDSKYNPESLEAYNRVRQGDIIINGLNLSFDFISQRVGLVKEDGVITSTYLALHPLPLIDSRYLTYLFKGYDYCKALHSMGRGLRATLGYKEFRKYSVIFPSLKEQQAIADYLDKKCGEIDEMVSLQEKIVEELKAYKQAVITEAVFKGLNPDVPMKDSGNKWIGTIPNEWGVARLKNVAEGFSNGTSATQLSEDISDYPVSRIETISTGSINFQKVGYIPYYSGIEKYELTPQDILISNINSLERVGNCAMYLGEQRLYHGMNLLRVRSKKGTYPRFLLYYLRSNAFIQQMRECCNHAINQVSVSSSTLKQLFLPLPPYKEQKAIADYLDTKCAEIDALISLKQSKIESLKEYKKSIIYEYITGKKDING